MGVDGIWSAAIALWLVSVLLLGGTGFPSALVQSYFSLSSAAIIAAALWRLRSGFPSGAATVGAVFAALSVVLVFLQLIPLPFETWKSLPGRDAALGAFAALGQTPAALPLTLDPAATKKAGLSILPPLAAFLAVLSLPRRNFWLIGSAIVLAALVGSLLGALQKGLDSASGLYFYHDLGNVRYATGTFANRNLFAAQLYASVPFLAAIAMVLAQRWRLRPLVTSLFTLVYISMLVAVLSAVGSRAGILLAMASVLLTMLLVFRPSRDADSRLAAGKGVFLMLASIIVMAQASMVGILRLTQSDPLSDFRGTIAAVGFQAAKAQFPAGSGFGTFVPAYQLYERPATIIDAYVNHAHNEWLELAIEGGLPALLLIALFALWLVFVLFKAMRLASNDPSNAHIRAAGVALVLILLHAIVDFPFRTDALLTFCGLCAGFLALASAPAGQWQRAPRPQGSSAEPVMARPRGPQAFRPSERGFARRSGSANPPAGRTSEE